MTDCTLGRNRRGAGAWTACGIGRASLGECAMPVSTSLQADAMSGWQRDVGVSHRAAQVRFPHIGHGAG